MCSVCHLLDGGCSRFAQEKLHMCKIITFHVTVSQEMALNIVSREADVFLT